MLQAWILAVYYALLGTTWYLYFSVADSHQHPWKGTWRATAVIMACAVTTALLAGAIITLLFNAYGAKILPKVTGLPLMIGIGCGIAFFGFVAGALRAKAHNARITLG